MYRFLALWAALLAPAVGSAQSAQQQAALAADPSAPVPPVAYQPLQAAGASALVTEGADWQAVNATVGQYPRGHMDILKWERAQEQATPPQPAPAGDAHQ